LLTAAGHVAEHVSDLGMMMASDGDIWSYALTNDAVIITKDEDFPRRRLSAGNGPRILWVRIGNTRRRELLTWFDPLLPSAVDAFDRGEIVVEIV
jgi:predicted nuclease of predicted toxin-antitoxin system